MTAVAFHHFLLQAENWNCDIWEVNFYFIGSYYIIWRSITDVMEKKSKLILVWNVTWTVWWGLHTRRQEIRSQWTVFRSGLYKKKWDNTVTISRSSLYTWDPIKYSLKIYEKSWIMQPWRRKFLPSGIYTSSWEDVSLFNVESAAIWLNMKGACLYYFY